MKSDTERKNYHNAKLHERRKKLHAHISKELKGKLKKKRRSILLRKGDKVKIVRGVESGKTGKIAQISTSKRKVYIEAVTTRTAKAKEVLIPIQPSNLVVLEIVSTPERKELFHETAFVKEQKPVTKETPDASTQKQGGSEAISKPAKADLSKSSLVAPIQKNGGHSVSSSAPNQVVKENTPDMVKKK